MNFFIIPFDWIRESKSNEHIVNFSILCKNKREET